MPGTPFVGWLYWVDDSGQTHEIFNHARVAEYLQNPALTPNGIKISDVLDFGGCRGLRWEPPCTDGDEGYADLSGTTSQALQAPDAAALDITGDFTLIVDAASDDWTGVARRTLMGKWTTAGQLSYALTISTTGVPQLAWTANGSTIQSIDADEETALPPGGRQAIRVDFDVNNGAGGKTAHFFTAPTMDGPWSRLGTPRVVATTTTVFSGSSTLRIGDILSGGALVSGPWAGLVYGAQVRNGMSGSETVGGSLVFEYDGELIPQPGVSSFLATTGQTITVLSGATLNPGSTFWEEQTYNSPAADSAPWYSATYPESSELLGFVITDWTGLGSETMVRPTMPRLRGAQLGAMGSKSRIMKFNVTAFARSEKAMRYGFRWLSGVLSSPCATCDTHSVITRLWCPTNESTLWDGVVEMRDVGLVEGPEWTGSPLQYGQCFVRNLSFTLEAGDPCMYHRGSPVTFNPGEAANVTACYAALPLAEGKANCRPTCSELVESCRTTVTFSVDKLGAAPVLTLTNDDDAPVPPLRVVAYADGDPDGTGLSPNPCGMPVLGEIYIRWMPPWSTFIWDVAGRTTWYRDATTGTYVDGWPYVDANDPPLKRDFLFRCGAHHIVIEPANWCLEVDTPNSRYLYNEVVFDWADLHFPTPTMEIVEREGCA